MLQLERSMTAIAASTGRPSILVYDRGLLDAKGYMDEADWFKLLDSVDEGRGITEEYCLKRYDGVVHLVTAADGAEDHYKWGWVKDDAGKPTFRKEAPKLAQQLDQKTRSCWRNHPRLSVIPNGPGGFKAKVTAASDAVLAVYLGQVILGVLIALTAARYEDFGEVYVTVALSSCVVLLWETRELAPDALRPLDCD